MITKLPNEPRKYDFVAQAEKINELINVVNNQEEVIFLFSQHLGLTRTNQPCDHKWLDKGFGVVCADCGKMEQGKPAWVMREEKFVEHTHIWGGTLEKIVCSICGEEKQ